MIPLIKIKKRENVWKLPQAKMHEGEGRRWARYTGEFLYHDFTGVYEYCEFINCVFIDCTFNCTLKQCKFDIADFQGHLANINYCHYNEYTGDVPSSYVAEEQETILASMELNSKAYRILKKIRDNEPIKIKEFKKKVIMTLSKGYPCHEGILYHYSELS